jgi:hypothetical protein
MMEAPNDTITVLETLIGAAKAHIENPWLQTRLLLRGALIDAESLLKELKDAVKIEESRK